MKNSYQQNKSLTNNKKSSIKPYFALALGIVTLIISFAYTIFFFYGLFSVLFSWTNIIEDGRVYDNIFSTFFILVIIFCPLSLVICIKCGARNKQKRAKIITIAYILSIISTILCVILLFTIFVIFIVMFIKVLRGEVSV